MLEAYGAPPALSTCHLPGYGREHLRLPCCAATDLMPVVECLKDGSSYDSVDACLDAISPWLQINEAGEVQFSLGAINGFIGGSVGVMGTVLATVVKKGQAGPSPRAPPISYIRITLAFLRVVCASRPHPTRP